MNNNIEKANLTKISYRAGTDLTYNRMRGNGTISRAIRDIAYIKAKDNIYIAISLRTGFTALEETAERAYSSLVFKLLDSLREVVDHPNAQIGQPVSDDLTKESLFGLRMPQDRQMRALQKGIDEFLLLPRENSKVYLRKIESCPITTITTPTLEDTHIDVDILDTAESTQVEDELAPVYQE